LNIIKPKISVILPFYNAERTIKEAASSILAQTYTHFELILIDNNSDDKSLKIVTNLQKKDSRIILIKERKQGVVNAFNKGLSIARGCYIVRMDADDISHSERLEQQLEYLEKNKQVDVVSCLVKLQSDINNNEGFQKYVSWLNSMVTYSEIKLNRFIESPIVNPSVMLRKEVFDKYGTYENGDFPEDYEFWLRLLQNGVVVEKINEFLFIWRDSKIRLTRTDDLYSADRFYKIKIKYLVKQLVIMGIDLNDIWIWGAGRKTRQRVKYLEEFGVTIRGYIDVNCKNKSRPFCIHYSEISKSKQKMILSFVGNIGAKYKIRKYLKGEGFIEGKNFFLLA